ncbi:hypothetical protein Tco_0760443 [Tanacetum coccineum]
MDEPEPHLAYDFFAPGPLPGYVGTQTNNNGLIDADVPLLGELGAEVDKPMVDSVIDELAEPIVAPMVVKEVNEEWLMAPVTPPLMPVVPPPSTYKIGGPSTAAAEGQSFTLPTPGFPVPPPVSDAEVADSITIGEMGPRVSTMEGYVQGQQAATQRDEVISGLSQQVQTLQAVVQQRDVQIQQLQTMVAVMSNRESTLMQCILGMDRSLVDLERRPPGPQ